MNFVDILNVIKDGYGKDDKLIENMDKEYVFNAMGDFKLFADDVMADTSEEVYLCLNKDDLISLVSGMKVSYNLMTILQYYKLGYYTGGHHDKWTWSDVALSNLNVAQLCMVYDLLKYDQQKR